MAPRFSAGRALTAMSETMVAEKMNVKEFEHHAGALTEQRRREHPDEPRDDRQVRREDPAHGRLERRQDRRTAERPTIMLACCVV